MKWATRAGIHIDRAACGWLIRRHVDEKAEFVFVADPADIPPDATAFDIPGAQLSHPRAGSAANDPSEPMHVIFWVIRVVNACMACRAGPRWQA